MATTAYGTHTGIETGVIGWGRRIPSLRLRSVAFALAVFALVLAPAASSTDATGRPAPHFANPTSTARQLVNRFFVLLAHKDRAGLQRFLSPGFRSSAPTAAAAGRRNT